MLTRLICCPFRGVVTSSSLDPIMSKGTLEESHPEV